MAAVVVVTAVVALGRIRDGSWIGRAKSISNNRERNVVTIIKL